MIIFLALSAVLIGLDQFVKSWIVQTLALHTGKYFIKGIVELFYIQNSGAAWGIFAGRMSFFYVVTIIAIAAMLYLMFQERKNSKILMLAYSFILAGAVGNFIDRIRLGYVIDMFRLEFIDFPIFNVADICLTIGVLILFVYLLFVEGKKENSGK